MPITARGTIPEPSDATIGRFLDGLQKLYTEAQQLTSSLPAEADPGTMLERLNQLSGDAFVKIGEGAAGLFADLCGSKPSKEQLLALPLRVRVRFYAWIQSEVVNPEAVPGAGTAAVRSLPSAAAG